MSEDKNQCFGLFFTNKLIIFILPPPPFNFLQV